MTANAQFAWWPQVDESLDARHERTIADAQYESEREEYTENPDLAEERNLAARRALGIGSFVAPEEESESISEVNEVPLSRRVIEHPDTPYINRLVRDSVLTKDIAKDVQDQIWSWADFIETIESNPQISPEISDIIISKHEELNTPEAMEVAQDHFNEDFQSEISNFQNGNGSFKSDRMEEVVAMVWEAYMTSGHDIDNTEKETAFNMAIETATNRVLAEHWDTLTRGVMFEVNNQDVRNIELWFEQRVTALSNMMNITYNQLGAKAGWRRALDRRMTQQRRALQSAGLEERHQQAQEALLRAQESDNIQSQRLAQAEYDEVLDIARETLSSWDIWAFDTSLEVWWSEASEIGWETT